MEAYSKSSNVARQNSYVNTTWGSYFSPDPNYKITQTINQHVNRVNTLDGYKNPYWRRQIAMGLNATTFCQGTAFELNDSSWHSAGFGLRSTSANPLEQHFEIDGLMDYGPPLSTDSPPTSVVTNVTNRCIRNFLSHIDAARTAVEAGQDFGEWKETVNALRSPLSSMRNLLLSHASRLTKGKKRFRGRPEKLHKVAADSYLEFTYGWIPLAKDIGQAYVGLQNLSRMKPSAPVQASASEFFNGSEVEYNPTIKLQTMKYRLRSRSKYTLRYKGAVSIRLTATGSIPPWDALQLDTVRDFAVTAWDLIPYSFLIDYFTNVGDIISAASFPFSDLEWGCSTARTETVYTYTPQLDPQWSPPDGWRTMYNFARGGNATFKATDFQRALLSPSQLIPRFQFSLPGPKPWLNIGALLIGNFSRLIPFF